VDRETVLAEEYQVDGLYEMRFIPVGFFPRLKVRFLHHLQLRLLLLPLTTTIKRLDIGQRPQLSVFCLFFSINTNEFLPNGNPLELIEST